MPVWLRIRVHSGCQLSFRHPATASLMTSLQRGVSMHTFDTALVWSDAAMEFTTLMKSIFGAANGFQCTIARANFNKFVDNADSRGAVHSRTVWSSDMAVSLSSRPTAKSNPICVNSVKRSSSAAPRRSALFMERLTPVFTLDVKLRLESAGLRHFIADLKAARSREE